MSPELISRVKGRNLLRAKSLYESANPVPHNLAQQTLYNKPYVRDLVAKSRTTNPTRPATKPKPDERTRIVSLRPLHMHFSMSTPHTLIDKKRKPYTFPLVITKQARVMRSGVVTTRKKEARGLYSVPTVGSRGKAGAQRASSSPSSKEGRSLSFKFRTTLVNQNSRKRQSFYFISTRGTTCEFWMLVSSWRP
jgi:hypothetical protein